MLNYQKTLSASYPPEGLPRTWIYLNSIPVRGRVTLLAPIFSKTIVGRKMK